MRAWRVRAPQERLVLRSVALLAPLIITPALAVLFPLRQTAAFGVTWSLFAGRHWDALGLGGIPASSLATGLLLAAGALLFLRDALPFVRDRIQPPGDSDPLPETHAAYDRVRTTLATLPPGLRVAVPALRVLAIPGPVLFCSGVSHPALTISLGTLARLDDDELSAALAHELEHVRRRDPALGWALLGARTLLAFNPASQIVGRQIVEEMEARADRRVADAGMGPALARAINKLSSAREPRTDLTPGSVAIPAAARLAERAAARAADGRILRLLTPPDVEFPGAAATRLALASAGLAVLLFFVV